MASDNEASCESDPNFAVICGFLEKFGVTCGLTNIDFLDLQDMLENNQEVPQELVDLHIKLLRKARKSVSSERWERAIIKLCHGFCSQDAWEIERFGYKKARLSSKLRILKELLEMQFDYNVKFKNEINKLSADELRTQPLGRDRLGHAYWFQSDNSCQIRVYKEDLDEETWALVAKDREGLVNLITQLNDGKEIVISEDSNSIESEKPIVDTGQMDSSLNLSKSDKTSTDDTSVENEPKVDEEEVISEKVEMKNEEEESSQNVEVPKLNKIKFKKEKLLGDDSNHAAEKSNNNTENEENNVEQTTKNENLENSNKDVKSSPTVTPQKSTINIRIKPISELISPSTLDVNKKLEITGVKEKYIRSDSSSLSSSGYHRKAVDSAGFDVHTNYLKRAIDEEEDVEEPSYMKRPRLDRPTLLGNKKRKPSSDEEDEVEEEEEVSDEVEEPLMLVKGEGSGRENECGNNIQKTQNNDEDSPIISDVVEGPILYFCGEGSGYECETGNDNTTSAQDTDNKQQQHQDSQSKTVSSLSTNSSNIDPSQIENKADTTGSIKNDNPLNNTDEKNNSAKISPKAEIKLGTIIDVRTNKVSSCITSPTKKSRWDVGKPEDIIAKESSNNPEETKSSVAAKKLFEDSNINDEQLASKGDPDSHLFTLSASNSRVPALIDKLEKTKLSDIEKKENRETNVCIAKEKENQSTDISLFESEEEIMSNSNSVTSKKSMFFFGPGCLQVKPIISPLKATISSNNEKTDHKQEKLSLNIVNLDEIAKEDVCGNIEEPEEKPDGYSESMCNESNSEVSNKYQVTTSTDLGNATNESKTGNCDSVKVQSVANVITMDVKQPEGIETNPEIKFSQKGDKIKEYTSSSINDDNNKEVENSNSIEESKPFSDKQILLEKEKVDMGFNSSLENENDQNESKLKYDFEVKNSGGDILLSLSNNLLLNKDAIESASVSSSSIQSDVYDNSTNTNKSNSPHSHDLEETKEVQRTPDEQPLPEVLSNQEEIEEPKSNLEERKENETINIVKTDSVNVNVKHEIESSDKLSIDAQTFTSTACSQPDLNSTNVINKPIEPLNKSILNTETPAVIETDSQTSITYSEMKIDTHALTDDKNTMQIVDDSKEEEYDILLSVDKISNSDVCSRSKFEEVLPTINSENLKENVQTGIDDIPFPSVDKFAILEDKTAVKSVSDAPVLSVNNAEKFTLSKSDAVAVPVSSANEKPALTTRNVVIGNSSDNIIPTADEEKIESLNIYNKEIIFHKEEAINSCTNTFLNDEQCINVQNTTNEETINKKSEGVATKISSLSGITKESSIQNASVQKKAIFGSDCSAVEAPNKKVPINQSNENDDLSPKELLSDDMILVSNVNTVNTSVDIKEGECTKMRYSPILDKTKQISTRAVDTVSNLCEPKKADTSSAGEKLNCDEVTTSKEISKSNEKLNVSKSDTKLDFENTVAEGQDKIISEGAMNEDTSSNYPHKEETVVLKQDAEKVPSILTNKIEIHSIDDNVPTKESSGTKNLPIMPFENVDEKAINEIAFSPIELQNNSSNEPLNNEITCTENEVIDTSSAVISHKSEEAVVNNSTEVVAKVAEKLITKDNDENIEDSTSLPTNINEVSERDEIKPTKTEEGPRTRGRRMAQAEDKLITKPAEEIEKNEIESADTNQDLLRSSTSLNIVEEKKNNQIKQTGRRRTCRGKNKNAANVSKQTGHSSVEDLSKLQGNDKETGNNADISTSNVLNADVDIKAIEMQIVKPDDQPSKKLKFSDSSEGNKEDISSSILSQHNVDTRESQHSSILNKTEDTNPTPEDEKSKETSKEDGELKPVKEPKCIKKNVPLLTCVDVNKLEVQSETEDADLKNVKTSDEEKPAIDIVPPVCEFVDDADSCDSIGMVPDNDPLADSDSSEIITCTPAVPPVMTLATFKLDTEDLPPSSPPMRITRKRAAQQSVDSLREVRIPGRKNQNDKKEGDGNKRPKLKGKRPIDHDLRRNIEEQKLKQVSSSEDDNNDRSSITVEPQLKLDSLKKGKGISKRRTSTRSNRTTDSPVPSSDATSETFSNTPPVTKATGGRKKKTLLGLIITPETENLMKQEPQAGVRQSRRIAQLKIKEEAERRKLEEVALQELKDEQRKRKGKKEDDKDYKVEKRKRNKNIPTEDDTTCDAESEEKKKRKRKRKHGDPRKHFDAYNPWKSSSGSSSSEIEEEEEDIEPEEDDEHPLILKSDHEFSPESDLEEGGEVQPLKRARTARKESDAEEEVDDCACQKCGQKDHPEWILLCDSCDSGWHCSCLRPALLVIPEGDWFCPPCQHATLVKNLESRLIEFDKKMNKREMEVRRKQRLAYVGISLDNVLPAKEPDEQRQKHRVQEEGDDEEREESQSEDSGSEESGSESESSSSSESDSEPIYQLRERRQAHSYRFNDYDDLIDSAIQDDIEAVKGAGNQGRGKDIATIVNAEKEEAEARLKNEEVAQNLTTGFAPVVTESLLPEPLPPIVPPEINIKEDDSEDEPIHPVRKIIGKKKHRKLNSLDVSSGDDAESDEDFKGTSTSESEEEFDDEELGRSDSSEERNTRRGKRRKDLGPVRRSTRARTSRYDKDFINDDTDSEEEAPRRKKTKSLWDDDSESEESDRSWGRRKRKNTKSRKKPSGKVKKSKKKKKKRAGDDSDPEVYRKRPNIKFGGLNEEEEVGRRTRGKKINYLEALGSDSEDEIRRKPPRIEESEEEFVIHEDDYQNQLDNDKDSDESGVEAVLQDIPRVPRPKQPKGRGKSGLKIPRKPKEVPPVDFSSTLPDFPTQLDIMQAPILEPSTLQPLMTQPLLQEQLVIPDSEIQDIEDEPNPIEQINKNVEEMNEQEMEKMMEEEDYANKQLQLVALQIEKEKKRKEREAKRLESLAQEQKTPKKRGRKPKNPVLGGSTDIMSPFNDSSSLLMNSMMTNNAELSEPPGISLPMFSEIAPVLNAEGSTKKRRGRGKGKKTLAAEAAAIAAATKDNPDMENALEGQVSSGSNTVSPAPDSPMHGSKLGIAAPPQPFSQSQPTPSVITRMLQSQPGQTNFPGAGSKYFGPLNESMLGPPLQGSGQFHPGNGPRLPMGGPYQQPPSGMSHYPVVRGGSAPPHRLHTSSPGPPNLPPMYHAHRSMDPSPSGGGSINVSTANRDRHSPAVVPPASSSPLSKGDPTPPPPPYTRTQVGHFAPGTVSSTPALSSTGSRHVSMVPPHIQQHRPSNMSPYHPGVPPNYYGAYPPPPLNADDGQPPPVYTNTGYSEPYPGESGAPVQPPDNPNGKPFDEETGGEFVGLVSYFSSQREDDLDT